MKRLLAFSPSLILAAVIFFASLLRCPDELPLPSFFGWDKCAHMGMYFLLAVFIQKDAQRAQIKSSMFWIVTFIICAIYGGIIEILQDWFTANRTADWWDWIADVFGAGIGVLIMQRVWIHHKNATSC